MAKRISDTPDSHRGLHITKETITLLRINKPLIANDVKNCCAFQRGTPGNDIEVLLVSFRKPARALGDVESDAERSALKLVFVGS
jgi:hypothetical protein